MTNLSTDVCIVGGGPCGVFLGVLQARAVVDVIVLEKYPDFFRDFRGDTVHPSTLQLLYELGWLDAFLTIPHNEIRQISANIGGETVQIADTTHLPTHCKFVVLMPQWDFLNFLSERGRRYPTFHLMMETAGVRLMEREDRVVGVGAKAADGEIEISAKLVVPMAVTRPCARVDRLCRRHRPGVLCLGDSAHAMAPIGGIGINLAIQDAVAAANILAEPLRSGAASSESDLQGVQDRRLFPTKVTQAFQVFIQDRAIDPLLGGAENARPFRCGFSMNFRGCSGFRRP